MATENNNIPNLREIRTMEEVSYLLNLLFTNMNNLNKAYYDLFINPIPMDVELERYNEQGQIIKVTVPNRAKDKSLVYKGKGDPNGYQVADQGALYLDTVGRILYFKSNSTNDAYGWQYLWGQNNLQQADNGGTPGKFFAPDGDGQFLTNLNASNINTGFLPVRRGGMGGYPGGGDKYYTKGMLLKGNGYDPILTAEEGVDYVGMRSENSYIGMIAYFPKKEPREGWLVCDGHSYNSIDYPILSKYLTGSDDTSGQFQVPDLLGKFIRCYGAGVSGDLGEVQEESVGEHSHEFSADLSLNPHSHEVDLENFVKVTNSSLQQTILKTGDLPQVEILTHLDGATSTSEVSVEGQCFGTTDNNVSEDNENRPRNIALMPMIRCDIKRTVNNG